MKYLLFAAIFLPCLEAGMSVQVAPELPGPVPVGTPIHLSAMVAGEAPGTLSYRFRARRTGTAFQTVRDFGPLPTLDWTASEEEGLYEIEVDVRNRDTGEDASASGLYQFASRATDGVPVISATANPLVFLYSAPACGVGSEMRVQFQSPEGFVQQTPAQPCQAEGSVNFYLAGMRAGTPYTVRHLIRTGSHLAQGPTLTLTTPDLAMQFPQYAVARSVQSESNGILLQSTFGDPVATDLGGNIVWFYEGGITLLTRPEPGGRFFGIYEHASLPESELFLREFDLAGMTVRETNVARINEQLAAMGRRSITGFHHEVRGLPDSKVLVLAGTEAILNEVQGEGPVDIIGDMILVLDRDLQVVWAWDGFDHLDVHRAAALGETCRSGQGGCTPVRLAEQANDWLHGNSLQLTPDGQILYSARHQDWLVKIHYDNGAGDGEVLWRLGKDGDFEIESDDPWPWFSHQHDANLESKDGIMYVTLFDNGNTRRDSNPEANSRGQVLRLDEERRVATLVLNADLGDFSSALGSAQELENGDYFFNMGFNPGRVAESVQVAPSGEMVYSIKVAAPLYRTFRMRDLYTP
jgi:hypothetical protein